MSLFINKNKELKSPRMAYALVIMLCIITIFGMLYATISEFLFTVIQFENNPILTSILQCLIIAAIGVSLSCLFFLIKDKKLLPLAYSLFGIITILIYISVFMLDEEKRKIAFILLNLYALFPVILGNIVSWIIYNTVFKENTKALRAEY